MCNRPLGLKCLLKMPPHLELFCCVLWCLRWSYDVNILLMTQYCCATILVNKDSWSSLSNPCVHVCVCVSVVCVCMHKIVEETWRLTREHLRLLTGLITTHIISTVSGTSPSVDTRSHLTLDSTFSQLVGSGTCHGLLVEAPTRRPCTAAFCVCLCVTVCEVKHWRDAVLLYWLCRWYDWGSVTWLYGVRLTQLVLVMT